MHEPGSQRQPEHFSLKDVPALITAIAALITALVGVGAFLAGRATAPSHAGTSVNNQPSVASSSTAGTQTQDRPNQSQSPQAPIATGKGTVIAHFSNLNLSDHYYIPLVAGGTPQPSAGQGDLEYVPPDYFYSSGGGELSLLNGASASFANCVGDTALAGFIGGVAQWQTVCFLGHGDRAAATVVGYGSSGGVQYATLDVTVWQN